MQGKYTFEYATVRIVPLVEREEFFNAGIILYCPDARFLDARLELDQEKVRIFCDGLDLDELRDHIAAF